VRARLAAAALAAAACLAGCAPAAVTRVARQVGASLYVPAKLPSGMRLAGAQRIGPRMAYIAYSAGTASLGILESPDPIAPPPGSEKGSDGVWRGFAQAGGQETETVLMHLPGAYVEVLAAGIAPQGVDNLAAEWTKVAP